MPVRETKRVSIQNELSVLGREHPLPQEYVLCADGGRAPSAPRKWASTRGRSFQQWDSGLKAAGVFAGSGEGG
eukprot:1157563-Pelagomonas_calceolata.AAC.9